MSTEAQSISVPENQIPIWRVHRFKNEKIPNFISPKTKFVNIQRKDTIALLEYLGNGNPLDAINNFVFVIDFKQDVSKINEAVLHRIDKLNIDSNTKGIGYEGELTKITVCKIKNAYVEEDKPFIYVNGILDFKNLLLDEKNLSNSTDERNNEAKSNECKIPEINVSDWFQTLNLGNEKILDVLIDEGFETMEDIKLITEQDLKEIGQGQIKLAHRKLIIKSLTKINNIKDQTIVTKESSEPVQNLNLNKAGATITVSLCNLKGTLSKFNGENVNAIGYDKDRDMYMIKRSYNKINNADSNMNNVCYILPIFIKHAIISDMTFPGYSESLKTFIKSNCIFCFCPLKLGIQWLPRANYCQTIVFVGPTGSGKSRLINYLLGKDLLESASSLQSVTKSIDACSVLAGAYSKQSCEYFLVDTVGLMDTTLSNKDVLQLATDGIKKGFKTMNRIVFVLRNGRVEPAQMEAIQQAIDWFDLADEDRKKHVIVVITHCDTFSRQASEEIIERYKSHKIIGNIYLEQTITDLETDERHTVSNFFCIGLPDLKTLDEHMLPIFTNRLVEQKAAFVNLFFNVWYKPIKPVLGFLDACTIS